MTVGSQLKQTVVGLKGAQATMRFYKEHSRTEETRAAFADSLGVITEIVSALEARLKEIEFAEPQYKGS